MKKYQLNSFNSIFFLLWTIITGILWIVDESDYPFLIQKILSAIALLGPLIVTTYFLCSRMLTKSIAENKILLIVGKVLLVAILQSSILWLFQEGLASLETHDILPLSENSRDRESFITSILESLPLTILVNLGFAGLKFYFEHARLYEQHLLLQKEYIETQLQSLQAQINPHFMFNVLNHIHILMQKDIDLASSLLIKYSDTLRYQLYGSARETVNIKDEIDFMNNYIEVEKYRWQNTLDINTEWKIEKTEMHIPPLLLITLIENAFKHVFRSKSQKGYINIGLLLNKKELVFTVENSRSPQKQKVDSNLGIGLNNFKRRLELIYPGRYTFVIDEAEKVYLSKLTIDFSNEQQFK